MFKPKQIESAAYRVDVISEHPLSLIAYDVRDDSIVYLKRELYPNGRNTFMVNIPAIKNGVNIKVKPLTGNPFRLVAINEVRFKTKPILLDKQTIEYVKMVNYIALNYGSLQVGKTYVNPSRLFRFEIHKDLQYTPCRIVIGTNEIEISDRHFIELPVPERAYYLFHEFAHNFISENPDSEQEADYHASELHLAAGYPVVSAISAMAKLSDTHQNNVRMMNIDSYFQNNINTLI